MKKSECLICKRISLIENGENDYFIKEFESGYAVLGDHQYFRGYSLLLSKHHVCELFDLEETALAQFQNDMTKLAKAVFNAFQPQKLNYELLGNSEPHLHWHIIPRYIDDLSPKSPIWVIDKSIRYAEEYRPTQKEITNLKSLIWSELD